MTLKRERGCVPAFLFYMEGSEIMADTPVKIVVDYDSLALDLEQKIKTNLDLSQFEKTIEQAQRAQATEAVNDVSNEIILAANNFLLSVKEAQDTIYQAELIANKLKHFRHMYTKLLPKNRGKEQSWKNSFAENISFDGQYQNYNEAKDKMIELFNNQKVKELYKKAEIFNNAIIKATKKGKELKTVVSILDKNNIPVLYEVDMQKFIEERMSFGYSSGSIANLVANFNVSSIDIADKLSSLKSMDNDKDNTNLNKTFQDVLERYKISKKKRYVMQKLNDGWRKAKVGSQGDLAEAYSFFYFTGKYNFNQEREQNVNTFIMEGVVKVDAISGLYQGDISEEELAYDYAIKKGNASFLQLGQVIKLSEKILTAAKNKENIISLVMKEYDEEKEKNKDIIRTEVSKVGSQVVSRELKRYLGQT